jgi:hypothetical protein
MLPLGSIPGNNVATETEIRYPDVLPGPGRDNPGPLEDHMTLNSQTNLEAGGSMMSWMDPKRVVNVGFWNVRTMYQTGKAAQIAQEFRRYKLDILGISECRWPGSGRIRLASGETIVYSGKEEAHEGGVAVMLDEFAEKCLLEWKPVSDRIVKIRMDSRFAKTTVIVGYAPTNAADDEAKEIFYDQLQATVREVDRHDVLIMGGDFNAKVGKENRGREHCMGVNGLGDMNENGLLFSDFCSENELVIGGTLFHHKDIHKYTWESPDLRTRNQIDHVTINRKWVSSLKDVRTRRGADVASDHQLLVASVKLSLRRKPKEILRRKVAVSRLEEDDVRDKFVLKVYNRYEVLQNSEVEDIDEYWRELRDTLKEAGEEVLGFEKRRNDEWISTDSWQRLEERRDVKRKMNEKEFQSVEYGEVAEEYRAKDKEVKKSVRSDKRSFLDKMAGEAEEAAKVNDTRTLFQISRSLSRKKQVSGAAVVKNQNGLLLSTEEEQLGRWTEHFESVLNRPIPSNPPSFSTGPQLDISTEPPTMVEILTAIDGQKNNKACGEDGVKAELFKVVPRETSKILGKLFEKIWQEERVPEDWLRGLIAKIPKKGDLKDCNNWRGVTLLNVASKIFAKCLFIRIQGPIEEILRKHQAGFRKGRACADQTFILRRVIEESLEFQRAVFVNFVDFEKAFDSVFRGALWGILREYGVPEKIIKMIRVLYDGFVCGVLHNGKTSPFFAIETGVKQGCLLSGLLFLLVIDWLLKRTTEGRQEGIEWVNEEILEDLDYADDLGLLSGNFDDLQEKTTRLNENAKKVGLKISIKKTEVMRVCTEEERRVKVEGVELKEVEEFTYLGSKISKTGGTEEDVLARVQKAKASFASLSQIWKSSVYGQMTKLRLFNAIVKSTLLWGCESWAMNKKCEKRLQVFQMRCLRRILRIFYPNLVSNVEVLRRAGQRDIILEIVERKWRWIGHIQRKDDPHLTKEAFTWSREGRRKRGRPRTTWKRVTEKEAVEKTGMTFQRLLQRAENRTEWRRLVSAMSTPAAHRA